MMLGDHEKEHPPMAKFWDNYHIPTSLDDALELLARYDGRARVVAGGTDLLLDFQDAYHSGERPHYDALIDVTRIQSADAIREENGYIVVGCGVTHAQLLASPPIQSRATALAEAGAAVGGPQVRNVATLVGNVAHALPAADGTVALMVLGAEAKVARQKHVLSEAEGAKCKSEEWQPLAALFKGPGESAVDPTRELIAAIRFHPTGEHEASAFRRVIRPQGIALPVLGMAARVGGFQISDFRFQIEDVAISAGPVAPTPFRATRTEEFLRGKLLDNATLAQATQILLSEVSPRTSAHRATREYRVELLPTMLREVLTQAVERAG